MAFEIIKVGRGLRGKKYVHRCADCDAIFTFEIEDLGYSLEKEQYFMYCPSCGWREVYSISELEEYCVGKNY